MHNIYLYLDVIELEGWVLKKVELGAMGAGNRWLGATVPPAPPLDPPLRDSHSHSLSACRKICGMISRIFATRDQVLMLKLLNTYIRSKIEYCCCIWSPTLQSQINKNRIRNYYGCSLSL